MDSFADMFDKRVHSLGCPGGGSNTCNLLRRVDRSRARPPPAPERARGPRSLRGSASFGSTARPSRTSVKNRATGFRPRPTAAWRSSASPRPASVHARLMTGEFRTDAATGVLTTNPGVAAGPRAVAETGLTPRLWLCSPSFGGIPARCCRPRTASTALGSATPSTSSTCWRAAPWTTSFGPWRAARAGDRKSGLSELLGRCSPAPRLSACGGSRPGPCCDASSTPWNAWG